MIIFIGEKNEIEHLNTYKKIDASIIYAWELPYYDISFGKCFGEFLKTTDEEEVLILDAGCAIDEDVISRMQEIGRMSEHHTFITASISDEDSYDIIDGIKGDFVLVYPKFPCLIADITNMKGAKQEVLEVWSKKSAAAGFQTININVKNKDLQQTKQFKLLLYMDRLACKYNGTSILIKEVILGICNNLPERIEVDVCACQKAIEFHKLDMVHNCKFGTKEELTGHYDAAFVCYQAFEWGDQCYLDEHCDRWFVWPLDVIAFRCDYKTDKSDYKGFLRLIEYADLLFHFTHTAKSDFNLLYDKLDNIKNIPQVVVPLPARKYREIINQKACKEKCPFSEFILVVGNTMPHKMIKQIIPYFEMCEYNFIVIGAVQEGFIYDNVYGYKSGGLSNDYVDYLYQNMQVLIFPSIYEGFGLPVVQALNCGKDVIVCNSLINHELESLAEEFEGHLHYMDHYYQLNSLICKALNNKKLQRNSYQREWSDLGKELVKNMLYSLLMPVDKDKILRRHNEFSVMKDIYTDAAKLGIFFEKYHRVYLYGAGVFGKRTLTLVKRMGFSPKGFVVSKMDGVTNAYGLPILPFEQIKNDSECGVILSMDDKNCSTVISDFLKIGYRNYLQIDIL